MFVASSNSLINSFRWGELESGQTTIAFTPVHQHETDDLTGQVHTGSRRQRDPVEICFAYQDVDAAYKVCVTYICAVCSFPGPISSSHAHKRVTPIFQNLQILWHN